MCSKIACPLAGPSGLTRQHTGSGPPAQGKSLAPEGVNHTPKQKIVLSMVLYPLYTGRTLFEPFDLRRHSANIQHAADSADSTII